MHQYRDLHEYHDGCYYCKYNNTVNSNSSIHPPTACEECPRGLEGYHEKESEGK